MESETEDLRGMIDKAVRRFVGDDEPKLVNSALNCILKGYDRRKTERKLGKILDDREAVKFTDKLYGVYEEYQTAAKRDKTRKRKDEKRFEENGGDTKKFKPEEDEIPIQAVEPQPSPGQLTKEMIADMMAEAQKQIKQRREQLNLPSSTTTPSVPNIPILGQAPKQTTPQPSASAVEKAQKAMALQESIQARLGSMNLPKLGTGVGATALGFGLPPGTAGQVAAQASNQQMSGQKSGSQTGPTPLILDEQGRTIDATTGEAVQLQFYTPSLKANIRAKRREQFKKELQERPPEEITESRFFDDRLGNKVAVRHKRGFRFHDKGKFEVMANSLRTKAQLEKLQSEIAHAAKKTGIASAAKLATILPKKTTEDDGVPTVEWWDSVILRNASFDSLDESIPDGKDKYEGVTHLVEHPTQLKPPAEPAEVTAIDVMLTARERKKLRRQTRMEAQKEIQEKVRLGLMPPPEPKVRLANLMRVLGTEAVQDPTKIEAHVRAQMVKRVKDHEQRNAERKLSKDERKDKRISKLKEDTSKGVNIAVYRVRDLSNPAKKFKVETNCNQLFMTGNVVLYKDCNVVVVEGGPKQQKKFKRLMMHRIKWSEDQSKKNVDEDDEDEKEAERKINNCVLVWEGETKTRAFGEMKFKLCPTESFAREQFRKFGVEQYWDLAYSGAVLEATGEDL